MTTSKSPFQRSAFLYIRVSTDEQLNGYSPQIQEDCLVRYCELNNITVLGIYREDYSAKTFNRPVFTKMLATLKKHKGIVNLLLFTRWDRFSRNAGDAYAMISQLKSMSVEPQGIEQPLDLDVPENKMMLAFYLAAPEVENDRRALNTLLGMRRAKKEGRYLGVAPAGYINEKERNSGKGKKDKPILVVDEQIAPVVVWVFEEVARGVFDLEKIRRMAGTKGLKVSSSQFWNLVRNVTYCGKVFIAAYKKEEAHSVPGIHAPLISEELFNKVQDILMGRKRIAKVRSAKDENLPLRGFLLCQHCGRTLTGSASKGNGGRYYYYHCQVNAICKERFRAEKAHEALKNQLHTISAKKEVFALYLEILARELKAGNMNNEVQIKETQQTIEKLKQRIQNAQTLMLDADIAPGEYTNIKNKLFGEIETLERKKIELVTDYDTSYKDIKEGGRILANIDKYYDESDFDGKQQIIGSIFSKKLVFEKTQLRTIEANPIMELIAVPAKDLKAIEKRKAGIFSDLSSSVPTKGIEPSHPCEWQILSLLRLPIPPHGHLSELLSRPGSYTGLGLQYYTIRRFCPKYAVSIFS